MNWLFVGLAGALVYGLLSLTTVYLSVGYPEARLFFTAYATSFNTLISLGLILGTALIIYRSQDVVPATVERAFTPEELEQTDYEFYKRRFLSFRRSLTFAATFAVVGFVLFTYCGFPLRRPSEGLMMVASVAQYALGVYVGRKLCYAGMMLHALLEAPVTRNLFRHRALDPINDYVHIASTLTVVFVYVHVLGYYGGPFEYDSPWGKDVRLFLVLPAVIATPVLLIFNFYPRAVLRKVYSESIDLEIVQLQSVLQKEKADNLESRAYVIEVDKMSRDELRYSLQLTLSDLPIGITILVMVLQPLLER